MESYKNTSIELFDKRQNISYFYCLPNKFLYLCNNKELLECNSRQNIAYGTVANSLPQNRVILLKSFV